MTHERARDAARTTVPSWTMPSATNLHDAGDDVAVTETEEPPECSRPPCGTQFRKMTVRKQTDHLQSLLTKAMHRQADDEAEQSTSGTHSSRRQSLNSNNSVASIAELTSDTGFSSPARTNTPSPPPPVFQLRRVNTDYMSAKPRDSGPTTDADIRTLPVPARDADESGDIRANNGGTDPVVQQAPMKRCISFACGINPRASKAEQQASRPTQPALPPTPAEPVQRKIKFACAAKPSVESTLLSERRCERSTSESQRVQPIVKDTHRSPSLAQKHRSPSVRSRRSTTPRPRSRGPDQLRNRKYLAADTCDLNQECSRFHEFASDEPQVDDWIRLYPDTSSRRLTINDTLYKENEIRRLGKEAEDEALQEEMDAGLVRGDDNDDDVDTAAGEMEEDGDEDQDEDDAAGRGSDDDSLDGYHTDNEGGFAESEDDEADDGDDDEWWSHGRGPAIRLLGATPVNRPGVSPSGSRSSISSHMPTVRRRKSRTRRIKIRPGTPELPDSTDFVCGTLDEDRPLEDAYLSCLTQKRREKLHLIPQDIDPSFPTSEPEDDDELDHQAHESEDQLWLHGELEDLHHEQEAAPWRGLASPRKAFRRHPTPLPKRHTSPPPQIRGRPMDRTYSPRRLISPPPPSARVVRSPLSEFLDISQRQAEFGAALLVRPGLVHTKSLPRAAAMFPQASKCRRKHAIGPQRHIRGAIDIVKGLEHKRQRRREKYVQKHCNRARKGQVAEKRPQPGTGAERFREIALHMTGKLGPDRKYVLSV